MNDYLVEDLYPKEPSKALWVPSRTDQLQPIAWDKIHTHVQQWMRTERLWEPLFVLLTFALWGWYLFWLYRALQDFTFIAWP